MNCGQKKKEKIFGTKRCGGSSPSRPTSGWGRILIKMGYKKLVECEDERQAALAGLQTKFVKKLGVKNRLGDCGVDSESASHTQINQLNGGMKVKVVLAVVYVAEPPHADPGRDHERSGPRGSRYPGPGHQGQQRWRAARLSQPAKFVLELFACPSASPPGRLAVPANCPGASRASVRGLWAGRSRCTGAMTGHRLDMPSRVLDIGEGAARGAARKGQVAGSRAKLLGEV